MVITESEVVIERNQGQVAHGNDSVRFDFDDTFLPSYQRNNKRGGKKHLRCFPFCGPNHKKSNACEVDVPVIFANSKEGISRERCDNLFALARFLPLEESGEICENDIIDKLGDVAVGSSITTSKLSSFERTIEDPLLPLYISRGARLDNLRGTATFIFREKAWHYGWKGGRYKMDMKHILRIYIMEGTKPSVAKNGHIVPSDDMVICVASLSSSPFTIYSSRTTLHNKTAAKAREAAAAAEVAKALSSPEAFDVNDAAAPEERAGVAPGGTVIHPYSFATDTVSGSQQRQASGKNEDTVQWQREQAQLYTNSQNGFHHNDINAVKSELLFDAPSQPYANSQNGYFVSNSTEEHDSTIAPSAKRRRYQEPAFFYRSQASQPQQAFAYQQPRQIDPSFVFGAPPKRTSDSITDSPRTDHFSDDLSQVSSKRHGSAGEISVDSDENNYEPSVMLPSAAHGQFEYDPVPDFSMAVENQAFDNTTREMQGSNRSIKSLSARDLRTSHAALGGSNRSLTSLTSEDLNVLLPSLVPNTAEELHCAAPNDEIHAGTDQTCGREVYYEGAVFKDNKTSGAAAGATAASLSIARDAAAAKHVATSNDTVIDHPLKEVGQNVDSTQGAEAAVGVSITMAAAGTVAFKEQLIEQARDKVTQPSAPSSFLMDKTNRAETKKAPDAVGSSEPQRAPTGPGTINEPISFTSASTGELTSTDAPVAQPVNTPERRPNKVWNFSKRFPCAIVTMFALLSLIIFAALFGTTKIPPPPKECRPPPARVLGDKRSEFGRITGHAWSENVEQVEMWRKNMPPRLVVAASADVPDQYEPHHHRPHHHRPHHRGPHHHGLGSRFLKMFKSRKSEKKGKDDDDEDDFIGKLPPGPAKHVAKCLKEAQRIERQRKKLEEQKRSFLVGMMVSLALMIISGFMVIWQVYSELQRNQSGNEHVEAVAALHVTDNDIELMQSQAQSQMRPLHESSIEIV